MTQGEFILTLLHAATNTHILHLQTKSYAEHMALGAFYAELPDLIDAVVESIQGLTGEIIEYPEMYYHPAETGKQELEELAEFVKENRQVLPPDSEIQNDLDAIATLINTTLYKLRFLR
jgi:hypothetical protein